MRIAYVTETWHPAINGVVTRLSATVRELARRGHDVLVVAPGAFDQPLEGVRVQGVRSVRIPFIYGGGAGGPPPAAGGSRSRAPTTRRSRGTPASTTSGSRSR